MNKETFINIINEKIKDITLENSKQIIINISDKLPNNYYDKVLCIIDNTLGNLELVNDFNNEINDTENKFRLIEDGELTFKSYSYETGEYDYFSERYDIEYYDSDGLSEILKTAYKLGITLVNKKLYKPAIKIFDLIIHTNYSCSEMGNPEYDYSNEVYDVYDVDLSQVKDLLDFDLNNLYSYVIYATYFVDDDKYNKIYDYLNSCHNIKFSDSYNLGIERMKNLDKFYQEFAEYLTTLKDEYAYNILSNFIESGYVDEYEICKKCLQNHPKLFLNYILKLFNNHNYNKIIDIVPTSLNNIKDKSCKNDICYIMVDSIKLSKSNLSIDKYLYEAFLSINNLPNFLVILYRKLYDDNIKKIVDLIPYTNNEYYGILGKAEIEDKNLFDFFLGKFEDIYKRYKSKNDEITYLIMLYLNNNLLKRTTIKDIAINILTRNFTEYHYKNLDIDMNNREIELLKLFSTWKSKYKMSEDLKLKYIDLFKLKIEKETEYLLKNKMRSSYHRVAMKIVMLDEVLSSNGIISEFDYINEYEKKYVKYHGFRKEIKELIAK